VKLPIGEAEIGGLEGNDGPVVAGLRPESFEDVSLIGDLVDERGVVFEAEIDLVESLGSDLYAYFHVESEGVESDQLADVIADRLEETGAPESREGQEQIVARLDPASKIKRRERPKLWADTSKLHLFDPESGESLRRDRDEGAGEG
jgi:multiple sugar transport system ATP-binding protein